MILLRLLLACACLAAPDPKAAQMDYLRGQLLERKGANAEALKAYESALANDPTSAYISREAADLALEMGYQSRALRWAQKAVELSPRDAGALTLLGKVQWAGGDTDAAQKSFEAALKLDPKSSESVYSLSGLLAQKSPDEARKLLERFLEQNPAEASQVHVQLAKLDLQAGKVRSGERHLKESIALDPEGESLPARFALAQAYETEASTEAALAEYKKIAKLDPDNVELLDHIAQLQYEKGDLEAMRQTLLDAKAAKNDDPAANHWLAMYAENKGDWAKAAQYIRDSAALNQEPGLNLRLGYYLTQEGKLDEAVAALENAHKRWPDNDQISYFLALGYDDLKRDDDAIKLLQHVVDLKPDFREARNELGVLLEKQGRMAEAEKQFRALLADKPDDAGVLNYLGYSLADRGMKLPEAEHYVARAVELEPDSGAYRDSLGWVHYKQGKSTQAVADLEQAQKQLPNDETVQDHLGDAYAAVGDKANAWLRWKRAESLWPDGDPLPGKAAKIENKLPREQLGALYLKHLKALQDDIAKMGGLCTLEGQILRQPFSYRCLFTFKAPDTVTIDILGPLFTPIFTMKVDASGFNMDPIQLAGLDPEKVRDAAQTTVGLFREYLSGRLFTLGPASYHKSWWRRRRWLELPGWRLMLDRASVRAEELRPLDRPDYKLTLSDFGRTEGREVPRTLRVDGRGFWFAVRFDNVKIDFAK